MAENNTSLSKLEMDINKSLATYGKTSLSDFFACEDEIHTSDFTYDTDQTADKNAIQYGMDLQEYLLFSLNDERYAIELTRIKEIIKISQITKVPHTPGYVAGIISLRGNIVPVYRLSGLLRLSDGDTNSCRTLVVEIGEGEAIGLIVDQIYHVVRFSSEQIEPPPATIANTGREFITGIGWEDSKMIILLDLDAVVEGNI